MNNPFNHPMLRDFRQESSELEEFCESWNREAEMWIQGQELADKSKMNIRGRLNFVGVVVIGMCLVSWVVMMIGSV